MDTQACRLCRPGIAEQGFPIKFDTDTSMTCKTAALYLDTMKPPDAIRRWCWEQAILLLPHRHYRGGKPHCLSS